MITLTQNEEKIITKIRQLSPDEIQKLEEFIEQMSHTDNPSLSNDQTEKKSYWYELASMFDDDPYFDEFVEAMAEERRRLAIEEMADYEEEEVSAA
jgi:F0F1-type ATP synthase delta subunit